jgi:restriction system protein
LEKASENMTIPDFQTIMLPLLLYMSDGQEHSIQELTDRLASKFELSEEELRELLSSGKQTIFYNRVGWARTYLSKTRLIEMTRRAYYRITDRGRQVLTKNPIRIDIKFLEQFPEYRKFREREPRKPKQFILEDAKHTPEETLEDAKHTPEETLEDAYQEIREDLAQELLNLVKHSHPAFFERLVVELLVKMGYGGSRRDAARAVGQAGDEGIDGIIDEDRLGLDTIYIQAKKWDDVVGRPEIQKFVGALMGKRSKKGIFITSSAFSTEAMKYVANIDSKIVLIDGKRLAELMIDYDVGVATVSTYQLKRVDSDYFNNG